MHQTILPDEMKRLEQAYMDACGVPGALLMERAAQGIVEALRARCPGGRVLFLCGPGNNGGDGYAAARLWLETGGKAAVWELTSRTAGDALMNRKLLLMAGVQPLTLDEIPPLTDWDWIVDALYGTGLSREITGLGAELIEAVNASGVPVLAVDIPSGVSGEDGRCLGPAVRARVTVTFHRVKQGLLLHEGVTNSGEIIRHPILIPQGWGDTEGLEVLEPEDIPALIPPRPLDGHKGTFGRAVIFAGSRGMAGAAALCANASIRGGAGLTTVLCRESILPIVQTLAPGATCVPLPEADGMLLPRAAELAERTLKSADAACIGPGLGQGADVIPVLHRLMTAKCPVVWDADALNLLAARDEGYPLPENAVITPHPGEAARLLDCTPQEITDDPLAALDALHDRCGCTVLLKGARTLMTDGLRRAVNRHGTPAMGKGGSGDVLSGLLTALLARRLPEGTPLRCAQLAALLHGLAGLRAAQNCGENSVTPQALIDAIQF